MASRETLGFTSETLSFGKRSCVFTGSKNRACERESREDHGKRKWMNHMVHVGTNNADKEGTTAIVEKYRNLLKKTKQSRVGQIIIFYQEFYQCLETGYKDT